ncbi:electron transport complex subunit G [Clostridia bacterium]|nr:electron transport complex subunit G [Clostridia bacterium]
MDEQEKAVKFKLPDIKLPKLKLSAPLKTILTLFIVAAVSAAALAGVNSLTAERISQNHKLEVERAVGSVLANAEQTDDALFTGEGGYAAIVAPIGYGGEINMVVGVSAEGAVTGVSIIGMAETPGIGTKVAAQPFLEQYLGKHAGVTIGHGENTVDAISGATVSSKAITKGVAEALTAVNAYIAGLDGGTNG